MSRMNGEKTHTHTHCMLFFLAQCLKKNLNLLYISLSVFKAALAELEAAVEGLDLRSVRGEYGQGLDSGDHAVEPLRLCLLRFLRGNSFDVSKALDQVRVPSSSWQMRY